MAEKYLHYFSEHDPMKKIYQGRLYKEQGKIEEAYEMFEGVLFSEYGILNWTLSMMERLALEEHDVAYAGFLAEKLGSLSSLFDRGKYNEYSAMLEVVCAEKNIEGTFQVVEQLLNNVDSLCDFQKSKLYRHMKFKNVDGSDMQDVKEKLLEGLRGEEELGYMKGYEPWEKLIAGVNN